MANLTTDTIEMLIWHHLRCVGQGSVLKYVVPEGSKLWIQDGAYMQRIITIVPSSVRGFYDLYSPSGLFATGRKDERITWKIELHLDANPIDSTVDDYDRAMKSLGFK